MKLHGTIKTRGTIEWCDKRQLFLFKNFVFDGTDPGIIEMQGDDVTLFGFADCTFNRNERKR